MSARPLAGTAVAATLVTALLHHLLLLGVLAVLLLGQHFLELGIALLADFAHSLLVCRAHRLRLPAMLLQARGEALVDLLHLAGLIRRQAEVRAHALGHRGGIHLPRGLARLGSGLRGDGGIGRLRDAGGDVYLQALQG